MALENDAENLAGSGISLPASELGSTSPLSSMGFTPPPVPSISSELAGLEGEGDAPYNPPGSTDIGTDSGGILGNTALGQAAGLNPQANNLNQAAPSKSSTSALLSDLFLRGVVIITGFIFVAVGLSMFKNSDAQTLVRAANPVGGLK